jgi:putative hemolysin
MIPAAAPALLPPAVLPRTPAAAAVSGTRRAGIVLGWVRHTDELREAQRLRFDVFARELGARLATPLPGHDIDRFDSYCEHLLVRDAATRQVIGTYRVLTPAQARRAGGTYSDQEFDLAPLAPLRARMVELGRSCVHPGHRHGGVMLALWGELAAFMTRNALDTMIGCASIPMRQHGPPGAAAVWQQLRLDHLAAAPYLVCPRLPLPLSAAPDAPRVEAPALIRAYLRLGARVLGPPAWDPAFNTADLPMMMRMQDLPQRYRHG